jgi:membrane dipeptidase
MPSLILNGPGFDQIPAEAKTEEKSGQLESSMLVDGHVDLTYYLMNLSEDVPLSALEDGPFTLNKIREVGVRLFSSALYCQDKFNGEGALRHLREILNFTLDHFDEVQIVKGRTDLESIQKDPERVGTLLLLENADALVGNLSFVEEMIETGIRIVGLTHRGRNRIGDGDGVPVPGGFSPEGMELIGVLDNLGLLIDVAHLHPKCFWKLLDIYNGPIVSSHTGIRTVCNIQRNIDMQQAKEIIGRGGLVGITFNPEMLTPGGRAKLEHVFIHIDVLVQKFGPEGVGMGSDFCGFDQVAVGLEDVTKIPQLVKMMLKNGYGEGAVDKIMGRNWLRLYENLF